MKVFFLKKEEFLPYDKKFLYGNLYKSEKRNIEFALSRFLLDYVLKNVYHIEKYEIETVNNKPKLKNNSLCFNISHSKEIVLIGFSTSEIGVDVELIKEKNLEKFSKYFNKDFPNLISFFDFWTKYEAEIKLQNKVKCFKSLILEDNYYLTLASIKEIKKVEFYQLIKNNGDVAIKEMKIEN